MRSNLLAAGLAVLSIGVAAGCGGDDENTSSTASTASTAASTGAAAPSAPAPKGDPIVLGTICSCTGPLAASLGKSLDVMKAWEKYTNENGGLNGHPVKVITVDDGNDPAKGLAGVKKLVEQDKVQAIVGTMSVTTASWEKYVTQKGVPVVGGQSVDPPFITNPNFFASGTTLPILLFGQLQQLKEAGKKKLAVFYCAETPGCATLEPILAGLGKGLGIEVIGQKVSTAAPSYTAPCLAAKGDGADALSVVVISTVVPRVVDGCAKQGFKPQIVATSAVTEKSWTDDANLEGSLIVGADANYTDESVPGIKTFTAAMDKYLPGLRESPQFSSPLLFPWSGGQLFSAAADAGKLSPTSTSAEIKDALYSLKEETLDGLAPPLSFAKGKPGFPLCYFPAELKDGAFTSLNGGKAQCVDQETAGMIAKALGG